MAINQHKPRSILASRAVGSTSCASHHFLLVRSMFHLIHDLVLQSYKIFLHPAQLHIPSIQILSTRKRMNCTYRFLQKENRTGTRYRWEGTPLPAWRRGQRGAIPHRSSDDVRGGGGRVVPRGGRWRRIGSGCPARTGSVASRGAGAEERHVHRWESRKNPCWRWEMRSCQQREPTRRHGRGKCRPYRRFTATREDGGAGGRRLAVVASTAMRVGGRGN